MSTDYVPGLSEDLGDLLYGTHEDVELGEGPPLAGTGSSSSSVSRPRRPGIATTMVDGAGIVGFTGPNGVGKTLVAVSCAIADLKRGRPVYSTVQIDHEYGSSVPITSYRQLLELDNCTVLLDEVAAMFGSGDSANLPREFSVFLHSLRHRGITLRWTAPGWSRAALDIRLCTQVVVGCHFLGKRSIKGSFWKRPVMILAGALDTTTVKVDQAPEKIVKRRIFVPDMLAGWGAYDTLADTPRIGSPATGGACVDCGGSTRREACTGDRHALLHLPLLPGQYPGDSEVARGRQRLTA